MELNRAGNPLQIYWDFNVKKSDGIVEAFPLEGKPLRLTLITPRGKKEIKDFKAHGNVIEWLFSAQYQTTYGDHSLLLEVLSPTGKVLSASDQCKFIRIVDKSCMSSDNDIVVDGETKTLTLSTEMSVVRIMPVVPEVGENGNWWVDGEDTGKPSTGAIDPALRVEINNKADKSSVPTKTSQLTNDSGFITKDGVPAPDWNASTYKEGHIKNRTHHMQDYMCQYFKGSPIKISKPSGVGYVLLAYDTDLPEKFIRIEIKANESKTEEFLDAMGMPLIFTWDAGASTINVESFGGAVETYSMRAYYSSNAKGYDDYFVALDEGFIPEEVARKRELKTINGQSLIGEGNININGGGGAGTLDSESVASTEATEEFPQVLYTEQTLTDAQKAQARKNIGADNTELKEQITELSEEIYTERVDKLPLNDNRYFNAMNVKVGGTYTAENGTSGSGVACRKFSVKAGEKYRLVGRYNYYAYKGYWITDANNVVTRMIADGESYNLELIIEGNESTLYVNCIGYNDEVDGVWKTTLVPIGDILEDVVSEVGELSEKVDNIGELEFSEKTILDDGIVPGYAFNLGGVSVGAYYSSTPTKYDGYAYYRAVINPNNTYIIKGVGSPYSFRFFAFLDKDLKVISVASAIDYDTRTNPLELHPPQNASVLIVNFMTYDATKDSIECVEHYSIKSTREVAEERWKGKRIVTFGDSISQFEDSNFMSYPSWLQQITNADVVNVGIGGTQLRARTNLTSSPSNDTQAYAGLDIYSLVLAATTNDYSVINACAQYVETNLKPMNSVLEVANRLQSIDWQNVDIVVVLGGTNDWYNGGGNLGETGSTDEKTTLGAVNKILQMLNSTYPHIQIYWFTPIVRHIGAESSWSDSTWAGNLQSSGRTLVEFIDIIKNEVGRYNIPICDLYRTLGWNQYNFKYYFNSGDGTHPNRGLRFIANKVASFIEANKTIDL